MATHRPLAADRRSLFAAAVALLLLLPGLGASADDSDLFTTRVAPNVVFLVDTSGSMNNMVWHRAYRPDVVYDPISCPYIADPSDPNYDPKCLKYPLCNIAYSQAGFDGGSNDSWSSVDQSFGTTYGRTGLDPGLSNCSARDVFSDPALESAGTETRWQLKYLQWYFSANVEFDDDGDGNTILQEILATNNGARSQCVLDQDPSKSATYSIYRRARVTAAKDILRDVICRTSQVAEIRYGLARYDTDLTDPTGGSISLPVADYTPAHATALENAISSLAGEAWTPTGETLYNVYRYFQSRTDGKQAFGKDGVTRFPEYNLYTNGSIPPSPLQYDCQKNFVIIVTDGEPTKDDFDNMNFTTFNTNLIGDYNSPGDEDETPPNIFFAPVITAGSCNGNAGDPGSTSCEIGLYLDDIAKFMQEHDFALDTAFPSVQVIDTYTVGFTTSVKANALLKKTAEAGNGEFYSSNSPEELAEALTSALTDIVEKALSFTAATVPASRTTDGNNFYTSYFLPRNDDPFWEGHLKNFEFTALGDILDADGFCATGAVEGVLPSPNCPTSGVLRTTANAFWDAAEEIPDPADRNLFVEFGNRSMFSQPLRWNTTNVSSADLGFVDGVDELDDPYAAAGMTDEAVMTSAVIDLFAGCVFASSPCVPRTNAENQKAYLGDIFHANPTVVGSPNAPVNESAYTAFANAHRTRTRVIYAGANDGWLHGFNAGDWQTKEKDANGNLTSVDLIPPRHDHGTGEELFGFMPYAVRNVVKDIPKQTGVRTSETVDGSPIVADAWFYRDASGSTLSTVNPLLTLADKVAAQWRTVLIGGLRDGGRSYYALDITDPTAAASDVSSEYPRYLWGFPCENATAFCSGTANLPGSLTYADYMGFTWSEPVITRVRVKADTGTDPRGYERWVAIFGAGYDPESDPNKKPSAAAYDVTHLGGRAIFMVDITTGGVLAMKYFDADDESISGAQIGYKQMKYAFASAPAVFDLNFDGFADVVYIGDVGGNLWKWVIAKPGDDPINNTLGDDNIAQPNWPFRLFFMGSPSASPPERLDPPQPYDDTIHYQSFFFPPTGVLRNQTLILAFGAGERAEAVGIPARYNDGSNVDNNHYYVVKDVDPLHRSLTASVDFADALTEADLADFDDPSPLSCADMKATKQGYYITARDAEKFITNSVIFLGTVFTASFVPPDPADLSDPCASRGESYLYSFDLECGVGKFTTQPGGAADKRRKAIGEGVPTRPRVSVGDLNQGGGSGGCKNKVVVITSDGNISNDCPGTLPGAGIKVRSWRER